MKNKYLKEMLADRVVGSFDEFVENAGSYKKGETILIDETAAPGINRCVMCGKKLDARYDHSWCEIYPNGPSFTLCRECRKKYTLEDVFTKLHERR